MSLRDQILAAKDIESELVEVPQWGVTVEVRGMTGRQRALVLKESVDAKGKVDLQKLYPWLVIMSTFDPETSSPVFLAGDFDAVAEKSGAALEVIAQVAMRLSGFNAEDISKNSEPIPSEDSTSN